jgi:hypothetical protein
MSHKVVPAENSPSKISEAITARADLKPKKMKG